MPHHVELVYFEGCPHADEARNRLREAFKRVGAVPHWDEWDTGRENTPRTYRRFGSPTILVDGKDVSGGAEGSGLGCVVNGGPSVLELVAALSVTGK